MGRYVLGGHYASVGLRLENFRINLVQMSCLLQDDLGSAWVNMHRITCIVKADQMFNSVGRRLVDSRSEPLSDSV